MPLKTFRDEMPSLNVTSLVDVLLCLILFFMAASKFTEMERKIGLQVPEVADRGALTPAPEKKAINIYRDGVILQVLLGRRRIDHRIDRLKVRKCFLERGLALPPRDVV